MGFMDAVESLTAAGDKTKVAGGLLKALEQHPGGVPGVIGTLRQNGLGEEIESWLKGQTTPVSPEQVQQGLNGTGLIEKTAQNAGVSQEVVKVALTTVLPMIIAHFTHGGQAAPQSEFGSLAQQFMGKVL